ncbi:MAG: hypothetical protein ACM30G_06775, partial [Micromonosporaceae bacterium]
AYAARLAGRQTPAHAREVLDPVQRHVEEVMLRLRLAEGLPLPALSGQGRAAAGRALADGRLEPRAYAQGRAVLTLTGRLLADGVVLDLLGDDLGVPGRSGAGLAHP